MLRGAVIGFTVGATAGWCLAVAKFGRLPSRMEEGVVVANRNGPAHFNATDDWQRGN